MSMTIRQVINALMYAKDLDKECIIEVNKNIVKDDEDDLVQIDVGQIVNLMWCSVIEAEEGEAEGGEAE